MSSYWNNKILKSKLIKCENLINSNNEGFLDIRNGDNKFFLANNACLGYNYTPDTENTISVVFYDNTDTFIAPIGGWLVANSSFETSAESSNLYINGKKIAFGTTAAQAPLQFLIKKGDIITIDTPYTFTLFPCNSEQLDLVQAYSPYDIVANVITYEDGLLSVKNQYIPDASAWHNITENLEVREGTSYVLDFKAYDVNDNFLYNIQSDRIVNSTSLYDSCTNLVSFNSDLSSLSDGTKMFNSCSNITEFNLPLNSLAVANSMFKGSGITSFTIALESLVDGTAMFAETELTSFEISLPLLENGTEMFYNTALGSFGGTLDSIITGDNMFNGTLLTEFNTNISTIKSAAGMFSNTLLSSFNKDLSNLENGNNMFNNCTSLATFDTSLSALKTGEGMFLGCCLNNTSLQKILSTLPAGTGILDITVDKSCAENNLPVAGGTTIPAWDSGNSATYTHNGWTLKFTCVEETKKIGSIKTITVTLPTWKTINKQYWNAGLWLVSDSASGYYIDVAAGGKTIRLRGANGTYKGSISGNKITIPASANLSANSVKVGDSLTFTIKAPAKTYSPSSYETGIDASHGFSAMVAKAAKFSSSTAIVPNTVLSYNGITLATSSAVETNYAAKWGGGLRVLTPNAGVGQSDDGTILADLYGSFTSSACSNKTFTKTLTEANIQTLLNKVSSESSYVPYWAVYLRALGFGGTASAAISSITIKVPAFTKTLTMKVTAVTTG